MVESVAILNWKALVQPQLGMHWEEQPEEIQVTDRSTGAIPVRQVLTGRGGRDTVPVPMSKLWKKHLSLPPVSRQRMTEVGL